MKTLTQDQKLALLVVPVLLFGILGSSYALAYESDLTDEQKDAIIEAHELRQSGDFDSARDVLQKAGVKDRFLGNGMGGNGIMHEKREAIRDAIEANDYDAYVEATKDTLFEQTMTKDMFATLVKAHELRQDGKFEEAEDLLDEVGIERPGHMMGGRHGGGMGMHRGWNRD